MKKQRASWRTPSRETFERVLRRALRASSAFRRPPETLTLSLVFVGDGTMTKLNQRYRGKRKTTDVLSFVYNDHAHSLDGEVAISFPQARHQARILQQPIVAEIQFLFVHGVLHLLGLDHERGRKEERQMIVLQKSILGREE